MQKVKIDGRWLKYKGIYNQGWSKVDPVQSFLRFPRFHHRQAGDVPLSRRGIILPLKFTKTRRKTPSPNWMGCLVHLVGGPGEKPLWKMMEFVNWDDDSNPIFLGT